MQNICFSSIVVLSKIFLRFYHFYVFQESTFHFPNMMWSNTKRAIFLPEQWLILTSSTAHYETYILSDHPHLKLVTITFRSSRWSIRTGSTLPLSIRKLGMTLFMWDRKNRNEKKSMISISTNTNMIWQLFKRRMHLKRQSKY